MRGWRLAVLAAVAALVACGGPRHEPPGEPPAEEAPPVLFPIAGFTADITPPSGGLDVDGARAAPGGTRGSSVWTTTPPATGGGISFNPARSIQLRTTANFAVQPGASGACTTATSTIFAPVEITNFFPERLMTLYVTFAWMNPSSHALCTSDPAPAGVMPGSGPPVTHGVGNVQYTAPFVSLRYSTQAPSAACDGCVVAGEAASRVWRFDYSTTGTFMVAGQIFAELLPQPPALRAPEAPSLTFGAHEQLPFRMFVYSTRDSEGYAFVRQLKVQLCPGTSAGCSTPGTEVTYLVSRDGAHVVSEHRDDFDISAADLSAGPALVPGTQYFMRVWNFWDVDGAGDLPGGAGGMVDGTVATETSFTLVGTPVQVLPDDGVGFGDGDQMQWTVERPDPGRDDPSEWFVPGAFQICSTPSDPLSVSCAVGQPLFTGVTADGLHATRFLSASSTGGVSTYTFAPDYAQWSQTASASNPYPRPAPGTAGYWRVRNQYADGVDRAGRWSTARKVVFGNKPTNLVSGAPVLGFDLVSTGATSAEVQWCSDAACASPLGTSTASGGPSSYGFDSTSIPRPFHWRARAVYAAGAGPWSAIVRTPPPVFVFEGDSLTSWSLVPGQEWPTQAASMSYFAGGTGYNVAVSGSEITDLYSRYVANVRPRCQAPGGADLFVWVGTNDFDPRVGGRAPATVFAEVEAYWQQARIDGCRVVAFTLYRNAADADADEDAFNALVRASPVWDVLVEPDLFMGQNRNPTYLHSDGIHPSVAGDTAIAVAVNAKMSAP